MAEIGSSTTMMRTLVGALLLALLAAGCGYPEPSESSFKHPSDFLAMVDEEEDAAAEAVVAEEAVEAESEAPTVVAIDDVEQDPAPTATAAPVPTEAPNDGDVVRSGQEADGDVDTEVAETAAVAVYGGTVEVALEAESVGLRPWQDACTESCYNIAVTVFDKLVERRADGTYGPWLAKSFTPNGDFTEWTFTLREGVTFHNGEPFTAETMPAIWNFWRRGSQSIGALSAAGVDMSDRDALVVTGPYEFVINLQRPNSALPATFERAPTMIFEPGAAERLGGEFSIAPVGTGPFVIASRDLDNQTTVTRNPVWWMFDDEGNQLPFLDRIVFRPIPDEQTRLDSLLSGTVNVMQTLRQGTIRDMRAAQDGYTLYEFQGNNMGAGHFNVAVPPFDDVRVRRGLVHAINQNAVIAASGGEGISLPATQWFSPDSIWYSEKVAAAWPKFDVVAARRSLLAYVDDPSRSDGKEPGEPIDVELSCPPDPSLSAAMQVIEQGWNSTGLVEVQQTSFDQQTHIAYALGSPPDWHGEHGAHCWRFGSERDPSTELNAQLAPYNPSVASSNGLPDSSFSPTNFFNYFDARILRWLNEATGTSDFDERFTLYEQVMMRFAEDVPVWYTGHTATMIATEDNVFGLNSWDLPDATLGTGHPHAEGRWHQVYIESADAS